MQLGINPLDVVGRFLSPGGSGGATPAMPGAPATGPTTVSPTFQQAFTPQFAPVMSQMQESPGARQIGAPTMYAPGGQAAATGVPPTPDMGMPPGGLSPYGLPATYPSGVTPFTGPVIGEDKGRGIPDVVIAGIIAATVLGGIMLWQRREKPPAKKGKK